MKNGTLYKILAMVLGVLVIVAGIMDVKLYMSGEVLDLNSATLDDFREEVIVEGDIGCVFGEFAVYEEKDKTFGITTSKRETSYYLVENLSIEDLKNWIDNGVEPKNDFVFVLSTGDDDMKAKLDANWYAWNDFYEGETDDYPEPVHFEGKLWQQPTDTKYIGFRDDALKDIGFAQNEMAEMKAMDNRPGASSLVVLGVGAALFLGGLLFLIIPPILRKKKENEFQEY